MRILLTSDLHGHVDFYTATREQARLEAVDAVIVAGDLFPEYAGFSDTIESQRYFVHAVLAPFARDLAREGRHLAIIFGNHDLACMTAAVRDLEADGLLTYAHGRCVPMPGAENFDIIGYNCVRPTRFIRKDWERRDDETDPVDAHSGRATFANGPLEYAVMKSGDWFATQPTIAAELASLPAPRDWRRTIFVSHSPPRFTALDLTRRGESIGSMAIRAYLETFQPAVSLHGHVHESPATNGGKFFDELGATVCFNAGQQTNAKIWHGLTFDLADPLDSAVHVHFGTVAMVEAKTLPKPE